MSDIAFHFDLTGIITGAEIIASLLFAGWWVRKRLVPWALC